MTDSNNKQVVLKTSAGDMTVEFFADKAPNHAANFIKLAESGFYNGTVFHRTTSVGVLLRILFMSSSWHNVFAVKVNSVAVEGTASVVVRERYEELSYPTQDDVKAMWAYILDGPGWLNTFCRAAWGGAER